MAPLPLLSDPENYLLCPEPGCQMAEWTHIESVVVRSRSREDGPVSYRRISAGGDVGPARSDWEDDPFIYDNDRRNTIIIFGHCEAWHEFAIRLRQHKGNTEVETKARAWR
jgi:hypothetical protein